MEFRDKLERLLSHWQEHNDAHVEEMERWVDEAEAHGEAEIAEALEACVDAMHEVGDRIEEALGLILSMEGLLDADE